MNFHGAVPFQKPALKLLFYLPPASRSHFFCRFAAHFSSTSSLHRAYHLTSYFFLNHIYNSNRHKKCHNYCQLAAKNRDQIYRGSGKKSDFASASKQFFCSVRILLRFLDLLRCWQLLHSAVLILLHNHHGFTSHHLNLPEAFCRWMIRRYFSLIVYFITVIPSPFFSKVTTTIQGIHFPLNIKTSFLTFLMLLLRLWLAVRQENKIFFEKDTLKMIMVLV